MLQYVVDASFLYSIQKTQYPIPSDLASDESKTLAEIQKKSISEGYLNHLFYIYYFTKFLM
jgi:hypothetical protein